MQRHHVDSSSLAEVGYDPEQRLLEVEFRHGGVYRYLGVPEDEYEAFRSADSLGRYLNQVVKPKYPAERVRGRSPKH